MSKLFWLHIKKSAGQSTRKLLNPFYTKTDRHCKPGCFLGKDKEEWNDILNNYRTPLGEYQFYRSEYAKNFLYQEEWGSMLRIAFARNPYDRVLSMYYHLLSPLGKKGLPSLNHAVWLLRNIYRIPVTETRTFSLFLDMLEEQEERREDSIFEPFGLSFSTHTNPMANDILDPLGNNNMSHIFKLENLQKGIKFCYEYYGRKFDKELVRENRNTRSKITLKRSHRKRIEKLFLKDFDIYENAL